MNKKLITIISFAALSLLLTACDKKEEQTQAQKDAATIEQIRAEKGKPVSVYKTANAKFANTREFSGTIEGSNQTTAIAKLSDPIEKINVQVGSKVSKDQVLAEFVFTGDNSGYEQATAQIEMLEKSLERMKQVQAAGGVSQQDIDQLETQLKVAKMQQEQARRAKFVLAPSAGTVIEVQTKVGEAPGVGGKICTIANIDQVILKLNITSKDIGLFKKGAEAVVELNGEKIKGKVSTIPLAANSMTRFFPVEVSFNNKGRKLLPGMLVTAQIHAGDVKGVSIPNDAVVYKNGINYAWIVDEEGKARRKVITLGIVGDDLAQVTSGIEAGESVIVKGVSKVNDGDKLLIQE